MRPPAWTQGTMRPRLVMLLSFAVAAVAIAFTGARFTILPSPPPAHATLPHKLASYLGVYEPHAPPSFQPIAEFGRAAGRQPNLVEYYSGWAEPFALSFARTAFSHGVIPFVQIDPTFASVSAIAAGVYDHPYLIAFADSVRDFGHPVVIGFGHEMNYEKQAWGFGHVPPATFVAAWRHIVTLFRSQGAENVTWLWTLQADGPQTGPIQNWWPGDAYVSWVGIDGYYYRPSDTFASIFGRDHQSGAWLHQEAGALVRNRGGARGWPVPQDPESVQRDERVQDARAGVVR